MITMAEIIPNLTNMLNVSYNDNVLISSNIVENYLLKKYASYYTFNNTPDEFKADFDIYNGLMSDGLNKIINAFNEEYNPIENYNSNIDEKTHRLRKYRNKIIYNIEDILDYKQAIIDYISGMSDTYAIKAFKELTEF